MPATHYVASAPLYVDRPACAKCSTRMSLARITPDQRGSEIRSFECPKCKYSKSVVTKPPKIVLKRRMSAY
jgi:hypothetical protein